MDSRSRFFRDVASALDQGRIVLPTLPEVSQRAMVVSQREGVSAEAMARELAGDPSLSARIVRIANSAALSRGYVASTLVQAIARIGIDVARVLIGTIATDQMYSSKSPILLARLRRSRANSVEVAALARILARTCTRVNPDEAMLAGLVHEIGILPIIRMAESDPVISNVPEALENAIFWLHPRIGKRLLRAWKFPVSMVDVPETCTHFFREHAGKADLLDVVTVANLLDRPCRDAELADLDLSKVPAFAKLGLEPRRDLILDPRFAGEVEKWKELLSG